MVTESELNHKVVKLFIQLKSRSVKIDANIMPFKIEGLHSFDLLDFDGVNMLIRFAA